MFSALFAIGSAVLQARAGSKAKKGAYQLAERIETSGEKQAGLLDVFAGRQEDYAGRYDVYSQAAEDAITQNTENRYKYATASTDLEEKEIPLLMLSIKRQVEDEQRAGKDRGISRLRRLNSALSSQVALRTAQGIQAYDGSPLAMMGADIKQFDYDDTRDKADTARRIVDLNFFGTERVKLMSNRVSLLRYGAQTEYTAGLNQAKMTAEKIALDAESIRMAAEGTRMSAESKREATSLEAEAMRISGGQASTAGYINAANTLLSSAHRYQQLRSAPSAAPSED